MELQKIQLRNGTAPKYLQIKEFIFEQIKKNNFREGEPIPSENVLAKNFYVTAVTASRALNELVNEGLLYRVRGKGTFVRDVYQEHPPVCLFSTGNPQADSSDPYFSTPLFASLASKLAENGLSLTVKYIENRRPLDLPAKDLKSGIAIIPALNFPDRISEATIRTTQIPIINIGAHPEEPFDCISFNNKKGMAQAVKHLAELGHTKIAFFSATKENISNKERLDEYISSIEKNGLVKKGSFIFPGYYGKESGCQSARALLKMKKRPTAVICSSDVIAVGAIEIFKEAGLRIPDDISIVGFGDYEIASYIDPRLTTVKLPVKEMGEKLADLVLRRINSPKFMEPERIAISTKLVVRKSTEIPAKN
ncbi:MAG: GntR family transcriptional regulator [Candidatus Omnitrophica bacterium]|nr:GntR family transcriptional regulator [Candidatus Omnitrophota bacterium]